MGLWPNRADNVAHLLQDLIYVCWLLNFRSILDLVTLPLSCQIFSKLAILLGVFSFAFLYGNSVEWNVLEAKVVTS